MNAHALSGNESLSNTCGSTLDPVLSLRVKVRVPAREKIHIAFATGYASTREEALSLADRYHDIHSFERESKLAWTKSQADMRHLNIDGETAYLYQRIAEKIVHSESRSRPSSQQRAADINMQSSLWPSGIGGDLPMLVVRIHDQRNIGVIRKLLRCHEYLRLKGLIYDFIILNEQETSYHQSLQDELHQQIRLTGAQASLNRAGGIFILRGDLTSPKDVAHLLAVARVSFTADEPLKKQVNRRALEEKYPVALAITSRPKVDKIPLQKEAPLHFYNGLGGFSQDGSEYVIRLKESQWTPAPWINVVGNRLGFGFQISECGSGFTWSKNSQVNRITPWSNDPVSDPAGEVIYLRDEETGEIWTPTPLPIRSDAPYTVRHGQGYTRIEHDDHGIEHELTVFVPKDETIKVSLLRLKNLTNRKRKLSLTSYVEWVLGSRREKTAPFLLSELDGESLAIFAKNPHDNEFSSLVSCADISLLERSFTCSRKEFLGRNGNPMRPAALGRSHLSQSVNSGQDPCAALQGKFELEAGEEREFSIMLGQCESADLARKLTTRYRNLSVVKKALHEVIQEWDQVLNRIQVKTPESSFDILMNRWLLYQTLSCRYWSRTAFYQSGGAYGFRDQLQDCMAFVYSAPKIAREHILLSATRQFVEGDVQHWWHPPSGRGIRTRMTDDLLWLPFVVSFYVNTTKDSALLSERVPFLQAPLLKPEEEDCYSLSGVSAENATIFDHCIRAIERALSFGSHDLPLMGTGDWNDGMNRVGHAGLGESIWLGWFLYKVITDFLPFCDSQQVERYGAVLEKLKIALEKNGWDGEWYKRAYFDDGSPLGSKDSDECKIDSLAQSWAVLSGAGDPLRAERAMEKVFELLYRKKSNLVLLFTPPFVRSAKDPGYIKGYVAGVRENGGQYTHAATWVVMAYTKLGDGNKAFELFNAINPIHHSRDQVSTNLYRIEPYVLAGDVYSGESLEGRGGWSWYTGSSSWYYRAGLESILGISLHGNQMEFNPCIPTHWPSYEVSYRFGGSNYSIRVNNPEGLSRGLVALEVDGVVANGRRADLVDDGKAHTILATLHSNRSES